MATIRLSHVHVGSGLSPIWLKTLKILIARVGNFINRTVSSDKESYGALSGSVYGG